MTGHRLRLSVSVPVLIYRYAFFTFSLFIVSFGIMITVEAHLGVDAWSVLHQGLAIRLPVTFGQASQVVGLLMIGVGLLLRRRPTLGTVMNMYFIGLFCDLISAWGIIPPTYGRMWLRTLYLVVGTTISGFGCSCYMSAGVGAGPRDTCMLALTDMTGVRVGIVRAVMEVTALTLGWFMGGNVGPGTVAGALTFGFIVEGGFKVIERLRLFGGSRPKDEGQNTTSSAGSWSREPRSRPQGKGQSRAYGDGNRVSGSTGLP